MSLTNSEELEKFIQLYEDLRFFSEAESSTEMIRKSILCGRGDTKMLLLDLAKPKTPYKLDSRSSVEDLIRERSGCKNLRNILLLITPAELPKDQKFCHKVHCYRLDNRSHRGATTVTQEDLGLIERHHGPDNYSIVYCTRYIESDDAVKNSPIRGQIFKTVREASKAVRRTWYRGHVVRLSYRSSVSNLVGVTPPKRNIFGIRSLKQPKIPVKMQRHLACEAYKEDLKQGRKLYLRRILQREFQNTSQQNLDRTNRNTRNNQPQRGRNAWCFRPKEKARFKVHFGGAFQREHRMKGGHHQQKQNSSSRTPKKDSPGMKAAEVTVLLPPQELHESMDDASLKFSKTLDINSINSQSLITSIRNLDPPLLPPSFSDAAVIHLAPRLSCPSVREDFLKLGHLVGLINERLCPEDEHLLSFFRLAYFLDFKMYVRREFSFPGWPSTPGRRFRIECYVFDDRREYIATICLLPSQFHAMALSFPSMNRNFRFINTAFELTPMPPRLTKWLRVAMEAINARPLYELFGELTLEYARPPAAIFELSGIGK